MVTSPSNCQNNTLNLGDIFTPHRWCKYFIEEFNLLNQWIAGKIIFDPTMGTANILESFVDLALEKGHQIRELPLNTLLGVEINSAYHAMAIDKFKRKYNVDMSLNFKNEDILNCSEIKCDILFGNPPWKNFNDICEQYKVFLKPYFNKYGLVGNPKKLLLGNSRIDIATLIIQKSISDNLLTNGLAIFFSPLSLLLNAGANENFRRFKTHDSNFKLELIYDFKGVDVFPDISTRYGLICFKKGEITKYPVRYRISKNNEWTDCTARPAQKNGDALVIINNVKQDISPIKIKIPKISAPRQGINSCGANDIFFFDQYASVDDYTCIVNNKFLLPKLFVFPLITSKNFNGHDDPYKWVLIPYNSKTGKPLSFNEISNYASLKNYLLLHEQRLMSRKGVMLNSYMRSGIWWAMLGVGAYNFSKYKIVWEAYGKKNFAPKIFEGYWQANQSLQAFIPCQSKQLADRILSELDNGCVEHYLRSFNMEGTMNWAQPGKMSALFSFEPEISSQFSQYTLF